MNWLNIIVFLVVGIVGLFISCWIVYGIVYLFTPWGPEFYKNAKVKTLSFHPSQTSTGVGSVVNANGTVGTIVTSQYTAEQNIVILLIDDIGRFEEDNEKLFNAVEAGTKLKLTLREKTVLGKRCLEIVNWKIIN